MAFFALHGERRKMLKRTLSALTDLIDKLAEKGVIESGKHTALKKAVRELRHAIDIKDIRLVEKAVDRIAKLLLTE